MTILFLGAFGLSLILLAFVAQLLGKMDQDRASYIVLNFYGASILALYAYLSEVYIFVFLEIIWALATLYKGLKRKSSKSNT